MHYNIAGVTREKTLNVVKNIIAAVASTNAAIAGECVNEAIKILTGNGQVLDNDFKLIGQAHSSGVDINIISQEKLDSCVICQKIKLIKMSPSSNF